MRLADLSLFEVTEIDTQTEPRQDLEPAMVAGGRKPHLDYVEKKVKGVIDRVTVELSGRESEFSTKLAKKYKDIDNLAKQLKTLRDSFNLDAKKHLVSYFDAEDEVLTRVLKTASLTLTLSKKTVEPKASINFEGFYQELLTLLPELEKQLNALIGKYTSIENNEKSPSLRVTLPGEEASEEDVKKSAKKVLKKESINEASNGFWNKVEELGSRLLHVYKVWGKQFDKKLAMLSSKMGQFAVEESNEHPCYADNPLTEETFQVGDRVSVEDEGHSFIGIIDAIEEVDGYAVVENLPGLPFFRRTVPMSSLQHSDISDNEIEQSIQQMDDRTEEEDDHLDPELRYESKLTEAKDGFADEKDLLEKAHDAKDAARAVHVKLNQLELLALRVASHKEAGADIDFEYVMANKFKHLSIEAEKIWDTATNLYFEVEEHVNGGVKKTPLANESIEASKELEKLISLTNRLKK